MAVDSEAASGPTEGNAGNVKEVSGLDKALTAALGGFGDEDGDVPLALADEAKKAALGHGKKTDAGDQSVSEDAAPPGNKAEAATPEAALSESNVPAVDAPKHWPEDRRKAFAALPPEAQKVILAQSKDLEGGFTRKSQELSDKVKFAESVSGLFDQGTRSRMAQAGMDEVGYVRYLNSLDDYASRDPVGMIKWFMQRNGVGPEHLGLTVRGQPTNSPQQQPQSSTGDPRLDQLLDDPAVTQLRSENDQNRQMIQQLVARAQQQEAAQQQWHQQQQQQARQSLEKTWGEFRSALDDSGQLAFPHADALMQSMGALMDTKPSLKAMPDGPDKLKKAYDMAVKADPELSAPLIEAEVARKLSEAEKKREAERAKKVTAVKPASGAPAVPTKRGGKEALDSALDAAFAKHGQ